MNDALFEELLNEQEGSALDFKRDQYPFYGASDEDKSELLKDVLAFANAWRRSPAYILVGVEEVQSGRARVVGVSSHLKDADLQQFINSKTQEPVTLSYCAFEFEGKQVGIIEIPAQRRPLYCRRKFGRVDANVVLVRRGSSTAPAQPEEVARMGAADLGASVVEPSLELLFGDISSRTPLGSSLSIHPVVLERLDPEDIMPAARGGFRIFSLEDPPENYYDQLIEYTYWVHLLKPLGFALTNTAKTAAVGVVARATVAKHGGVVLADTLPTRPSKQRWFSDFGSFSGGVHLRADPIVTDLGDRWALEIPFGNLNPRDTTWTTSPLFLAAERPISLDLELSLSAGNLSNPALAKLRLDIAPTLRGMTIADTEES